MASSWRTVRVFVSSTFRDMHAERNHLVRHVFPALRERLQTHRVHLVDVDLRWGVTREQVENNQVLGLCLTFVDECRPFSIAILGERYGWVPDQVPPETLTRFGWLSEHGNRSLTELEILHAAFHVPDRAGRMFFYFRDPAAVGTIPRGVERDAYLEADPERARLLHELKQRIRQSGSRVTEYQARWDPEAFDRVHRSRGQLTGLERFGQQVCEQLWEGICAELGLDETDAGTAPDPDAEEAEYHERFMESRLRVYVGRRELEARLRSFASGDDPWPCALTGPSGSGKSAALANLVAVVRRQHPEWLVVPHFVGASPGSTDLRQMLRRFCLILQSDLGDAGDVPDAIAELARHFGTLIQRVPEGRRVLFVIDALNQLDASHHAQDLEWLPDTWPSHVKAVVSCIEDPERVEPALDALNGRPHHLLRVESLTDVERFRIIHDVPMLSAKTLDHTQVALLLDNPATANPLFLLVALEELRGFGSYDRLRERIEALPRGFDALDALFAQVIERLEEEFGEPLVRLVLSSLAASRRGLSETELRALADSDDVYPAIRQLRPYLQHRGTLLDFYHRNLFKAVRTRYLPSGEARRSAHGVLAAFFAGQAYDTADGINRRKVDELPWQWLRAEQWDALETLFTDPAFLEAKTEAGLVFDLAADFHATLDRFPPDRPLSRVLRLYNEVLVRNLRFVSRHPTTLFQCYWNEGWWYDSPQAAACYAVPQGGWVEPPPWERPGPRLYEGLEAWREGRGARGRQRPWLRALRPPVRHLGSGELGQLAGRQDSSFSGLAFIPGTSRLLALSNQQDTAGSWHARILGWNAETGEPLQDFAPIQRFASGLACSTDGRFVIGGHGATAPAPVWDTASRQFAGYAPTSVISPDGSRAACMTEDGVKLYPIDAHRADRSLSGALVFSPDGRWIAAGRMGPAARGYPGEVVLFDASTGAEAQILYGSRSMQAPESLAWFPDSRRLAASVEFSAVSLFEVSSGKVLQTLHTPKGFVSPLSVSSDGTRILGIGKEELFLWEVESGRLVRHIEGVDTHVVAWSPDGRMVAAHGEHQPVVTLWDIEHAETSRPLGMATGGLAVSADGLRLAAAFEDRLVIQDFESGRVLMTLEPKQLHSSTRVSRVAFSPDGTAIAAVVADGTIRLWDLDTREERCLLDGRQLPPTTQDIWPPPDHRALAIARSLVFSPDGRWLATGTWMGDAHCDVLLVEAATGALRVLRGHENGINDVRFSPDGTIVVSASTDGTVRLWDARTGELLRTVTLTTAGADDVERVWFTADGHGLAGVIGSLDPVVDGLVWSHDLRSGPAQLIWDGDDPQVLAQAAMPRFRGLVQGRRARRNFVVRDGDTARPIAWAPRYLGDFLVGDFLAHPSGRMWAGRSDVFRLEDAPDEPEATSR